MLSDAFVFVFRLLVFIVFGTPWSMFVLNLLAPHKAVEFARNPRYFGPKLCAFYERQALKWPFFWAKWWMKLDDLSGYSVNWQIKYFLKVSFKNKTEVETLKAMQNNKIFWPDPYEKLFFNYGQRQLPLEKEIRSHTYGECVVCHYAYVTVIEFMMRHVRLSYKAFESVVNRAVLNDDMRTELKNYLAAGAINANQLNILIDAVSTQSSSGNLQMLGVLIDYAKRYNLRSEHWKRIRDQYPKQFIELLEEATRTNQQVKFVRSLKDTAEGRAKWEKFCKETAEILPVSQGKMTSWQYDIFHETGHQLCTDAILAFLRRSDKTLWKAVFERETLDDSVLMEIGCHIKWNAVYKEVKKAKKD